MRRSVGSSFTIFMVRSWPAANSFWISSTRLRLSSETWTRPSMPSPRSTKAPKSVRRAILPVMTAPTLWFSKKISQTLGSICFTPRLMRWARGSRLRTLAMTSSPFFTISPGCLIFLVQLKSDTWIRPSMPSSSSTKAPNSVMLRTVPVTIMPGWYFSAMAIQGLGVICFMPRLMRRFSESTCRMRASTWSPRLTMPLADLTFLVQLISETCTRPSMPGSSSTNAP